MKSLRILLELEKLRGWQDDEFSSNDFEFFEILLRTLFIETLNLQFTLNQSQVKRILKGMYRALRMSRLYNQEFLGIYILRAQILDIWREEDAVLKKIWEKEIEYHEKRNTYQHWFDQWIYKKFTLDNGISIENILYVIERWGTMLDLMEEVLQKRTFLYSCQGEIQKWEDIYFSHCEILKTRDEEDVVSKILIREGNIQFILSFEEGRFYFIIPEEMRNKIYDLEVYDHNSDIVLKKSHFEDLFIVLPQSISYFFVNRIGAFVLQQVQLLEGD